jgi:hypothetical protein
MKGLEASPAGRSSGKTASDSSMQESLCSARREEMNAATLTGPSPRRPSFRSRASSTRSSSPAAAGARRAPDLVGRDFSAAEPNLKACGDLTEIPTAEGKLYVAAVEDLPGSFRTMPFVCFPVSDRRHRWCPCCRGRGSGRVGCRPSAGGARRDTTAPGRRRSTTCGAWSASPPKTADRQRRHPVARTRPREGGSR